MATQAEIEAILKFKDEASAQIKAIQGRVEDLTAKKKQLEGGVGQLRKGFSDLTQQVTGMSPAMLGLAGAVTALGLGAIKAVKDTIQLGDSLVELNAKTGIGIVALQELKFAAEQNDIPFNTLTQAVQMLGQRAAAELPDAKRAIEAIGLSLEQIVNAKPEDAFLMVAERIKLIPNPAQQAAVAMAAFGRSGLEVLPGINQNLEESILKFREMDAAMSEGTARAAADLKDQLSELNVRWTELKTIVGSAVIPALTGILSPVQSLKEFFSLLGGAALMLGAHFSDAFSGMAKAASTMAYAISLVKPEFDAVGGTLNDIATSAHTTAETMRKDAAQAFLGVTAPAKELNTTAKETGFVFKGLAGDGKALEDQFKKTSDVTNVLESSVKQLEDAKHYQAIQDRARAYVEEVKQIREATAALQPYLDAAKERVRVMNETLPKIVPIRLEEEKTVDITKTWADGLSEVRGIFDLLGGSADSTFGKILGWASKIFDMFNGITGLISKIMGLFGGGGGLGSLFGGAGGAAGAAGGGLGGLGGMLGGLLTNPLTALIGGGIGAFFGLKSLFGKKGSAETTADVLGIDFDALSKDFQKRLQELGKQSGDFALALQVNLGEIFNQGGVSLDSFAEKIADTYSFLERGQITAAQAQGMLNQTVGQLLPHLDSLGASGVEQLQRLIGAAEHFGVTFEGIDQIAAFLGQTVTDSTTTAAAGLESAAMAAKNFQDQIALAISAAGGLGAAREAMRAGTGFIPGMQHGGYVPPTPGGSLRRLGEGGEGEFVVPESQMGGGVSINLGGISISGPVSNPAEVARKIADEIAVQVRKRGTLLHGAIVDVSAG